MSGIGICFLGGARYRQPLDATSAKKFRMLAGLGELFVIGFSQDVFLRQFTEHAHFYLFPKLPLSPLRYALMFVIGPLLALWLVLRHGVRVLIAQSPYEGVAAAVVRKVAGWLGFRVVLTVESHGDFEASLFLQRRVFSPALYRLLMRLAVRVALRNADILRAISSTTAQQLRRLAPGKPFVQFPTWTDIELFIQAGTEHNAQRSLTILYAGVLTPLKGVHHLLNAFARVANDIPQARLVIVGRDEDKAYAAELKARAREFGLGGHVMFIGEVPQEGLVHWMQQSCALVLPSFSEGLGRVIIEAMATGTLAIGSRVGGIPDIVQDKVTGFLVRPGDEEALAEKIRWVLEHPSEAAKMGQQGRQFAREFFSTEAYLNGYQKILHTAQNILQGEIPVGVRP